MEYLHKDLTEKIINSFYNVYNKFGYGFHEKVYKNALFIELNKNNLKCQTETPVNVFYDEKIVGNYFADIIVDEKVIIEKKSD